MISRLCAATVVLLLANVDTHAGVYINGSIAFGSSDVSVVLPTNATLQTATTLGINSFAGANTVQAVPTGDYAGTGVGPLWAGIPFGTAFSISNLNLNALDSFTVTNTTYGTFSSVLSQGGLTSHYTRVLANQANSLIVVLAGNFTPTGAFGSIYNATPSVLRLSFNESGSSIGVGITLTSTPPIELPPQNVSAPEPATLFAALLGAIPVVGVIRRRLA